MAYTVMNTDGLGQGLQSIAQIFAQGPSMAVEADLARQKRNALVAATALDQQKYNRLAASDTRSSAFAEQLRTQPPEYWASPEGRAAFEAGLLQFGDTGPVVGDARNNLGAYTMLSPEGLDPTQLSNAGFGAGTAWGSTPNGAAAALENDLKKQILANQGELQKTALGGILGSMGLGTGANQPKQLDDKDIALIDTEVDNFLAQVPGQTNPLGDLLTGGGTRIPDSTKAALRATAAQLMARGVAAPMAVQSAADQLGLNWVKTKSANMFGSDLNNFWHDTRELQATKDPSVGGLGPASQGPGLQVVQNLLANMGIDLGGIAGGIGAGGGTQPSGLPPVNVGVTIPRQMLPQSLLDDTAEVGTVRTSASTGMQVERTPEGWKRIK